MARDSNRKRHSQAALRFSHVGCLFYVQVLLFKTELFLFRSHLLLFFIAFNIIVLFKCYFKIQFLSFMTFFT